MKTTVIAGCIHLPNHDSKAVSLFQKITNSIQPKTIILAGDIMDCYSINPHGVDPKSLLNFQYELNTTKSFLGNIRQDHPKAKIVYLGGNHELWNQKYLWKNAKNLAHLKCLELEELLDLKKYRINMLPYGDYYELGKDRLGERFVVTHGTVVRGQSGNSARGEMQKAQCSGISFHTHRQALVNSTSYSANRTWLEGGCLCNLNQEYVKGVADWQQGFCIVNEHEKMFHPQLVRVNEGKAMVNGTFYA